MLIILAAFTVLGLLFSSQVWVDYSYGRTPIPWSRALAVALSQWYLWAAVTPLVLWLARRFRLERGRWMVALAIHLPLSVVFAALAMGLHTEISRGITGARRGPVSLLQNYVHLLTYWAIVGISYTVEYYNRSRDRELRAAQLEGQLAAAQLQALRLQLHPHFLFNTLTAIGALMRDNVDSADRMLTRLSDLLRATLDASDVQELTLQRELELLQPYLDIQQTRIGDRLTMRLEIEPSALPVLVPTLMLQPLVENAITHGVADRSGPGLVELTARVQDGRLDVAVRDDGPGPPSTSPGRGYGVDNVRQRLRAIHGDAASITIERHPQGGAVARVVLPARAATEGRHA